MTSPLEPAHLGCLCPRSTAVTPLRWDPQQDAASPLLARTGLIQGPLRASDSPSKTTPSPVLQPWSPRSLDSQSSLGSSIVAPGPPAPQRCLGPSNGPLVNPSAVLPRPLVTQSNAPSPSAEPATGTVPLGVLEEGLAKAAGVSPLKPIAGELLPPCSPRPLNPQDTLLSSMGSAPPHPPTRQPNRLSAARQNWNRVRALRFEFVPDSCPAGDPLHNDAPDDGTAQSPRSFLNASLHPQCEPTATLEPTAPVDPRPASATSVEPSACVAPFVDDSPQRSLSSRAPTPEPTVEPVGQRRRKCADVGVATAHACFDDGSFGDGTDGQNLYRMEDGNRWAFHNDTEEFEMTVTARFGPDSSVMALGNAVMTRGADGWFELSCDVIKPGETALFKDGRASACELSVQRKRLNPRQVALWWGEPDPQPTEFQYGFPSSVGDLFDCFDEKGLLYRIESPSGWAFFNATPDRQMEVVVTFPKSVCATIAVEGKTKSRTLPDGSLEASCVIYPGNTEAFIAGRASAYGIRSRAVRLGAEYIATMARDAAASAEQELRAVMRYGSGCAPSSIPFACAGAGIPFVDADFPPSAASMGSDHAELAAKHPIWLRPKKFTKYSDSYIGLFDGLPSPMDPGQGALGTCWQVASFCAMAGRDPLHVQRMFESCTTRVDRKAGAYRVVLNVHGWWTTVIVDDYLPSDDGTEPSFAANHFGGIDTIVLWPSLLEKAMAKLNKGYGNSIGGSGCEALSQMTGFPTVNLKEQFADAAKGSAEDRNNMFRVMYALCMQGAMLTVGTGSHSYAVLQMYHSEQHNVRLVHLRNPWGREQRHKGPNADAAVEYEHPSHETGLWESIPDVAKACNNFRREQGAFWMQWDSAMSQFESSSACLYQPEWFDYRVGASFNNDGTPSAALLIHAEQRLCGYFLLTQPRDRSLGDAHADAKVPLMLIANVQENANRYTFVCSASESPHSPSSAFVMYSSHEAALYLELEAGKTYLLVPRTRPHPMKRLQFVFGMQTSRAISDGVASVEFVKLSPTNAVFRNCHAFALPPGETQLTRCAFQVRDPEYGRVHEGNGVGL